MNIFIFDLNIKNNVESYCDDHIRKMPIETAQMLSYCHHLFNNGRKDIEDLVKYELIHEYQQARANHPCSIWVRKSIWNYQFMIQLGMTLCKEFEIRFGHKIKSEKKIVWMKDNFPALPCLTEKRDGFIQCMPDQYKVKTGNFDDDAIQAYRNYFIGEKASWATWNRGGKVPEWLSEEIRDKKKTDKINWLEKQRVDAIKVRVGSRVILQNDMIGKIIGYPSNNDIKLWDGGISRPIKKSDIIEVVEF